MWVQSMGIALMAIFQEFWVLVFANILLGLGTAMVYPTLLAAIGDVAHPKERASVVGIYRLWRDSGYAAEAIIAGVVADSFGLLSSIWLVAIITFLSGLLVIVRMSETLKKAH